MERLTNKEEEVMKVLWKLKTAFVKEILAEVKGDRPHYNTLSTLVRKLEEKKYVGHEAFGHTHRYYPLVTKEEFRVQFINSTITDYYDNSYKSLVLFFAKEEKISVEDLKQIIANIEKNK